MWRAFRRATTLAIVLRNRLSGWTTRCGRWIEAEVNLRRRSSGGLTDYAAPSGAALHPHRAGGGCAGCSSLSAQSRCGVDQAVPIADVVPG
jgi:hypothetical protein